VPPNRIYSIYSFSCLINSVFLLCYHPSGLSLCPNRYILHNGTPKKDVSYAVLSYVRKLNLALFVNWLYRGKKWFIFIINARLNFTNSIILWDITQCWSQYNKLYWSGSRTLIVVGITAQLLWFSVNITGSPQWLWLQLGAGLPWGEEASGQQLGVQQGGTWLDSRYTVRCLWVSDIGVERHSLLSLTDLWCCRQTSPFCSTNGNYSSRYRAGNAPLMWQVRRCSLEVADPAVLDVTRPTIPFLMSPMLASLLCLVATDEWMTMRPSQAKVLTGGGDLRFA
jgi:hypothetical protein